MRLSHLLLIGIVAAVVGCTGPDTPTLDSADTPALNSPDTTAAGSADAAASGSTDATAPGSADATVADDKEEPDAITVQHCLIGFSGSVGGKPIKRSKDEAGKLAAELLEKLQAGGDFDEIITTYTDDSPPGIYKMANSGLPADRRSKVFSRDGMVPAFGNVGFKLDVGEYGVSEYDPKDSPYGWHIIKRLK